MVVTGMALEGFGGIFGFGAAVTGAAVGGIVAGAGVGSGVAGAAFAAAAFQNLLLLLVVLAA